ncbi:protein split ends-like isoform X2 [Acanthaster planci]|uniref:Protein split ends-like isoform X2 n=1 Tax=Acanthaster planci TaxID=133434 RepID=A0A8B7YQ88_ACAPL|nr:protein split ends-like isoform X2 [Acanthaster planci]
MTGTHHKEQIFRIFAQLATGVAILSESGAGKSLADMNPIWRVTMEMSKSRSENQKLSKKRREMLREKTRREKEERRLEAVERDRERFIIGQEQHQEGQERYEELEDLQESAAEKFQKELCWCIQQTRVGLANIKSSAKEAKPQVEEAHKLLRILTSTKAPMARKRQVMRAAFGDYRSKMQQEERKHKAEMSKRMCLEPVSTSKQGSSTFYRMSNLASASPPSQILSTSSDLPGEAGPSRHDSGPLGHGLGSADNKWLEGGEVDTSMQELEKSTEGMHIVNPSGKETENKSVDHDKASPNSMPGPPVGNDQMRLKQHEGECAGSPAENAKRPNLPPNLKSESQPFTFNFDIREKDLDRSESRWRGSNKNIDGSLSENSTPEKFPLGGGSGRKKSGSRRRNRGKKKQLSISKDKDAVVAVNQATVTDNQTTVKDGQTTDVDKRSTVTDNQKNHLEADGEFRFNFPEPVEQVVML